MDKKNFYITTPIYYASGQPHIGHAYSTIAADAMARFKRLQGCDVMFLTGMDEHGQKVEQNAGKENKTPQKFVDEIAADFKNLWKTLDISYDKFIRTTDDFHVKAVQKIFKELYDKGDIYKGKYEGWYCTPDESFFTDKQLKDGKCPDCGREVKWTEEEAYFFKLSKYADRLLEYYEAHPQFAQPEMIEFIKSGLDDLCVSRTSFKWGIPVTFDEKHVVYVWLDALTNYITAQGFGSSDESDFKKYWPADVHFVGKEIFRFHVIIWPAILMALGLPLPKEVYAHGWILFEDGNKMSKSRGNVVDPKMLCKRYKPDALRYFLLREFSFGQDGMYSNKSFINRINFDLANDLGNLVSRTTSMVDKFFGGALPKDQKPGSLDAELATSAVALAKEYESKMERFKFASALADVWLIISKCNKYIDETMPWQLGKLPEKQSRLAAVLYNLCESLRIISILIAPVMPETSEIIRKQIGATKEMFTMENAKNWGILPCDSKIEKGEALFPRMDVKEELEALENLAAETEEEKTKEPENFIGIEDFAKVSLIVGKVKECEKVKKSKKLLKLAVDDGEKIRTIVSGISQHYEPEELIGKNVIIVSNLKPVKLCGVESNGMILATQNEEGKVTVIFPDESIQPGSKLS